MTLHLPDVIEQRLEAVARERGIETASLALELLTSAVDSIPQKQPSVKNPQITGERFFKALRNLPGIVPMIREETFSRSTIYLDHD